VRSGFVYLRHKIRLGGIGSLGQGCRGARARRGSRRGRCRWTTWEPPSVMVSTSGRWHTRVEGHSPAPSAAGSAPAFLVRSYRQSFPPDGPSAGRSRGGLVLAGAWAGHRRRPGCQVRAEATVPVELEPAAFSHSAGLARSSAATSPAGPRTTPTAAPPPVGTWSVEVAPCSVRRGARRGGRE
jgi:hypothetical protein